MSSPYNINSAIESSIVNYLTSSYIASGSYLNQLSASGLNLHFYTGMNNKDIINDTATVIEGQYVYDAPAIIVSCRNANEVAFNTRVYEMDVEVTCAEISADTQILGQLPMYVFNEFVSSSIAAQNFTNNNISIYQVQIQGFDESILEDSIHSKGMFRIIGGLI